ncbi:MAG: DUF309 domain-containing protein [Thermoanaerobaculia bacterium]
MSGTSPPGAESLARGLRAFRDGRFFEAHEEWEAVWLGSSGAERRHLQGLIQVAAACVHLGKGRRDPAVRLLALAAGKLADAPHDLRGLPARELAERARLLGERLEESAALPDAREAFSPGGLRGTG